MTARLRIQGATKRFGGVHALRGVDLEIAPGEIHALIGENGAGKSTLMKVLAGAVRPDAGALWIDGAPYEPRSPKAARERGVAMIYQELNLCPDLTVLQNVTLGAETTRRGFHRQRGERAKLSGVLEQLGVRDFSADTPVARLGPGDRQLVEIARALMGDSRILVFDEPTSSLSKSDVDRLFQVARRLADGGVSIVWISHFLDEVLTLGDRYTVLRDGETVATGEVAGSSVDTLVSQMVGRSVDEAYPRSPHEAGEVVLAVEDLAGRRMPISASFELRRGEVLGVFGLVGAGRTEMLRALYGLDPLRAGTIRHKGTTLERASPSDWVARGLGLVSEDRKHEGLATGMSIADNVTVSSLRRLAGRLGHVTGRGKRAAAGPWTERLGVRAASLEQRVGQLSGGNQQKVAIARLLFDGADVLLLDEPTRGIDVGAKVEVYRLLDELAQQGHAILVVSSYLPELFGVADRIAVMHRGALGPALPVAERTEEDVLDEAARGRLDGAA